MNRIYSKAWKKSLNPIVVAPEQTSREGACTAGSGVTAGPRLAGLGSALALLGLVSAAWLPAPSAMAADAYCYDSAGNPVGTTSGTGDEVACGQNAVASGANAIAIGSYATANPYAVAVGYGATATGLKSVASGFGALASGGNSLALSSQSVAFGEYEMSIGTFAGLTSATAKAAGDVAYGGLNHLGQINFGSNAGRDVAGYNGVYIGGSAGQASTGIQNTAIGFFTGRSSIGDNNTALGARAGNNVRGDGNVAIGFGAGSYLGIPSPLLKVNNTVAVGTNARASENDSIAIGLGATADDANSVALGAGSATAAAVGTAGTTIRGINYSFAGTAPVGTISVGSVGNERTLTNVAAGRIDAASTDAVNGSQLFATNSAIDSIGAMAGAGFNLSAQGSNTSNAAPGDTVDLNNSDGNIVVSKSAVDDKVTFNLADDLNVASSVTVGDTVITTNGVSIGTNVTLGNSGLFIMGGPSVSTAGINAGSLAITNVAAGVAPTDAVNVSQLQGGVNDAIGQSNTYTDTQISQVNTSITNLDNRVTNVEGDITNIQGDVLNIQGDITNIDARVTTLEGKQGTKYFSVNSTGGGNANNDGATGVDAIAIGKDASATATDSVAIGNGATATHDNSIALGAGSATTVGAQVNYNAAYVGNSTSSGELNIGNRTITGVAPGIAGTDAVNVNQLNGGVNYAINQANSYTDGRIDNLYGDLWNVRRGYRGATSSAMAMAGLPQAYLPGKSMLAMSLGGYQGEYGMAVGLSGITESGRYVYKAQASGNTAHDVGFSVGAGIQW